MAYINGKKILAIVRNVGGGTPPTGTKQITTNGTHDVTDYASVNVNVPTSSASGGTTVPNSGYVEKVYFNTALSTEEVVSILSRLTYIGNGTRDVYHILFDSTNTYGVYIIRTYANDIYTYRLLSNVNGTVTIFDSSVGWTTESTDSWNPLTIGFEVASSNYTVGTIGAENYNLTVLVSTTPFKNTTSGLPLEVDSLPSAGVEGAIYKVGTTYYLCNGTSYVELVINT